MLSTRSLVPVSNYISMQAIRIQANCELERDRLVFRPERPQVTVCDECQAAISRERGESPNKRPRVVVVSAGNLMFFRQASVLPKTATNLRCQ